MAPLQPLENLKFHRFFFKLNQSMLHLLLTTLKPPPPLYIKSFSNANLWICIEEIKKKRKDYEQNKVFQDF
jgi:hypothetical protein